MDNSVDPVVDDHDLQTYNLDFKLMTLRDWIDHQSEHYKANETGHLFMVFGDDFRFANAHQYFSSLDKLIKGFNAKYQDVQL